MGAADRRPDDAAPAAMVERRGTVRWIAVAAAVGLTARLAFGLLYWVDQPLTRDEREYLSLARSLAAGHGFVYDESLLGGAVQPFGRAPGYPAFLALTGGGQGPTTHVPTAVKIAQSLVGAVGVVLLAVVAWRLAGPAAARAGAAIAAVYPPLVWVSSYAFSEALFWPLGLLVVWTFDRAFTGGGASSRVRGGLAGALTAAGILVRPGLLLFVPLVVGWLAARRRWMPLVAFSLGLGLALAPWMLRNYAHHGRFVAVASEGGVTFWTGNNGLAIGEGDMAANPAIKAAQQELRARHPELSEEEMEPVYYREAFAWIRDHPGSWALLELRKLFYLVMPIGPSYTLHSGRYVAASVVSYALVLAAAVPGFIRLGPRRRRSPGLWLLACSAVVTALVFFPQERFRIPVIDPTLIVCAAALAAGRRVVS